MPLIELKNITKTFKLDTVDVHALVDVSLAINDGEFIAIMGHSGSGKSTLMNMIGLLDRPTSGEYRLDGRPVSTKMSDREQAKLRSEFIGFVFQSFNLLPNLTVLENVALPSAYLRNTTNPKAHAKELLEQVGLSHRLKARPNQLSGGERQRTAIARALMNQPRVILADEPTGNLDSKSGEGIINVLKELHEQGRTLVLVTHNEELAKYANRIVRMKDGRIVT